MTFPRISLRALTMAVLLIAADLSALRLVFGTGLGGLGFGLLGVVPMANLLAIGLYRVVTDRDMRRPSIVGFELSGLAATLAWLNLCLALDDKWIFASARRALQLLSRSFYGDLVRSVIADVQGQSIGLFLSMLALYISTLLLVQLIVGLAGGWAARRIVISAGRRAEVAVSRPGSAT